MTVYGSPVVRNHSDNTIRKTQENKMPTATKTRRKPAATTTKPTARKATATKAPARKTATKPAPKTSVKNAPRPKAAAKAAPAKAPARKTNPAKSAPASKTVMDKEARPRVYDPHNYVENSDSSIIANCLVEGGESRSTVNEEITERITNTNGILTRGGKPKNIASLTSSIMKQLVQERGYTVESSFRLIPPPEVAAELKKKAAAEKRAATRAANGSTRPARKKSA